MVVEPARVYTISREGGMTLGGRSSEESLELEVLKGSGEQPLAQAPASQSQPSSAAEHSSHHRSSHHRSHQQHVGPPSAAQPLQSSGNMRRGGSRDDYTPDCVACLRAQSQRSLDLHSLPRDGGKQRKTLERMYSEERASADDRGKRGGTFTYSMTI